MTEHIEDQAGFIGALSKDDPERVQAEQHAGSCPSCRAALDEGIRLSDVLKRTPAFPPVPSETLTRLARAVRPDLAAAASARHMSWATAGALVVAWFFQITVGSGFDIDLRCLLVSLGVLAVAIASVTLLRNRGRTAALVIVATSGIFAYLSGTASGLDAGIGIRCAVRELWAAAIVWAIVVPAAWRERMALDRWHVVAVAGAGGLAAHAGQHLACEMPHSDLHLLIFHFGAVVLAALFGAAAARPTVTWLRRLDH
jgi:hypothetical protein